MEKNLLIVALAGMAMATIDPHTQHECVELIKALKDESYLPEIKIRNENFFKKDFEKIFKIKI